VVVTGGMVGAAGDGGVGGVRPVVADVPEESASPGGARAGGLDAPTLIEVYPDVFFVQVGQLWVELPALGDDCGGLAASA